jgi:hypothetical protein
VIVAVGVVVDVDLDGDVDRRFDEACILQPSAASDKKVC